MIRIYQCLWPTYRLIILLKYFTSIVILFSFTDFIGLNFSYHTSSSSVSLISSSCGFSSSSSNNHCTNSYNPHATTINIINAENTETVEFSSLNFDYLGSGKVPQLTLDQVNLQDLFWDLSPFRTYFSFWLLCHVIKPYLIQNEVRV